MIRWAWLCLAAWLAFARAALALPDAFATVIQAVRYEPAENALYLPFEGPRPPTAMINANGRTLFIDIPRAGFAPSEVYGQFERSPLIRAFAAAYDPEIRGVHLVIEGAMPLSAIPDNQYRGSAMRFFLAPRDPRVTVSASTLAQTRMRVVTVPRNGGSPVTVSLDPTGEGMRSFVPRIETYWGPTNEQYVPQNLAGTATGITRLVVSWDPYWQEWGLALRASRGEYAFDDPDIVGATHTRLESHLLTALSRQFSWGRVQGSTGVGYEALINQVYSSVRPTAANFFFAEFQALHGPVLHQALGGSIWGPLGGIVEIEWAPWLFAAGPGDPARPWLTHVRLAPRLTWWPDHRLSLGMYYDRTLGDGFNRESWGATLGMSFSGF